MLDDRRPTTPGRRERLVFTAKLAVGLGLTAYLATRLDADQLAAALAAGAPAYAVAACAWFALSHFAAVPRFLIFARRFGVDLRTATRVYFISLFLSNFLPATIGGDVYKVLAVRRRSGWNAGLVMATLERVVGVVVLVAMGVLVLLLDRDALLAPLRARLAIEIPSGGVLAAGGIVAGTAGLAALIAWRIPGPTGERWRARFARALKAASAYGPATYLQAAALSVVFQAFQALGLGALLSFFGETVAWPHLLVVTMVLALAGLIPISVGALGVVEGTLAACLVALGADPTAAVGVALLNRVGIWLFALVGGLWFVVERAAGRPLPAGGRARV